MDEYKWQLSARATIACQRCGHTETLEASKAGDGADYDVTLPTFSNTASERGWCRVFVRHLVPRGSSGKPRPATTVCPDCAAKVQAFVESK